MPRDLALARNRIQGELGDGAASIRFEVNAEQTFSVDDNETRLQGQADIVAVAPHQTTAVIKALILLGDPVCLAPF